MKKLKVIIPVLVLATIAVLFVPTGYKKFKAYEEEKAITAEYEAFLAGNKVFFDNSFFNGYDVSGLTPDEALKILEDSFEDNEITIKDELDMEKDVFSYSELSVDYKNLLKAVLDAYASQELTKAEYIHGAEKKEYEYNIALDVDFSKIDVDDLVFFDEATRDVSTDAYISVDKITGSLSVVEEHFGNEVDKTALKNKLESAILGNMDEITLMYSDHILPQVLSTDAELEKKKEYYSTLLNKTINLNVCLVPVEISNQQALSLFDFEPGDEVDDESLDAFVRELKNKYDTYQSARLFNTSTGEVVTVFAGDYGWLIDAEATKAAIKEAALSNSMTESVEAVYTITGQRPAVNEISNTYVEIDLRDQKIFMYVDGVQVVNDDVTTGMVGDPDCLTRTGTFSLAYKVTNVVLKGPTWNDFVFYWMPYDIPYGVGIHDATWRTDEEFGGENRFGNGSHGCVNCRVNSAGTIYNYIQMDTPIVVWE